MTNCFDLLKDLIQSFLNNIPIQIFFYSIFILNSRPLNIYPNHNLLNIVPLYHKENYKLTFPTTSNPSIRIIVN